METGVDFDHRIIDLRDKPDDFLTKYREASGGYGSGMVPLLEHGDNLVIESDVVAKYVAEHVAKVNEMYPSDEYHRETIDEFLDLWFPISDKYYDVLTATSEKEALRRETIFTKVLEDVEIALSKTEGDFLLGDTFFFF